MEEIEQIKKNLVTDHPEWEIIVKASEGILHFMGINPKGFVLRRSIKYNTLEHPLVASTIKEFEYELTITKNLNKDGRDDKTNTSGH